MAPEARGGVVAITGFRSQDHLTIARIPKWLADDGFSSMIREAHGDAEAAFHVPGSGSGISREFVEYKDYELNPAKFKEEIGRFQRMHVSAPGAYRRFVLATAGLSVTLRPLENTIQRLRGALPFYADVSTVSDASYADYQMTAEKLGIDVATSRFIYDHVVLETSGIDAERYGASLFAEALNANFPGEFDVPSSKIEKARTSLANLLASRTAKPVTRHEIIHALGIGLTELPDKDQAAAIRMHTVGTGLDTVPAGAIPFKWLDFFGGSTRSYPSPSEWDERLMGQLRVFHDWIISSGRRRVVALSGSRRLSTSVAIGSVLSAVSGFRIDLDYRGEIWSTAVRPLADTPKYPWREDFKSGLGTELVVGMGIVHDPSPAVKEWIEKAGRTENAQLYLHSPTMILSAEHATYAVMSAKAAIRAALRSSGAKRVHLFLAVPAHFALLLGHHLNATAPMVCHEQLGDGSYTPTCTVW